MANVKNILDTIKIVDSGTGTSTTLSQTSSTFSIAPLSNVIVYLQPNKTLGTPGMHNSSATTSGEKITSGTPIAFTNGSGDLSSITMGKQIFTRVGNVVNVSGAFEATINGPLVYLKIQLPIFQTVFLGSNSGAGSFSCSLPTTSPMCQLVDNQNMTCQMVTSALGSVATFHYTMQYVVEGY